jgi:hypothetical protein
MQKSQIGLLQSLLYQVLRACPDLLLEVCPSKDPKEPWKMRELFETLGKVSKQTALPAKFCFFVDGLGMYIPEFQFFLFCSLIWTFTTRERF